MESQRILTEIGSQSTITDGSQSGSVLPTFTDIKTIDPAFAVTVSRWKGALTTVFVPPTTCTSVTSVVGVKLETNRNIVSGDLYNNFAPLWLELGLLGYYGDLNHSPTFLHPESCYPTSFFRHYVSTSDYGSRQTAATFNYYSPGVCPESWTSAPLFTKNWTKTSTAVCCPPNYTFTAFPALQHCASLLTAPTEAWVIDRVISTTTVSNPVATAYPLYIKWNSADNIKLPFDSRGRPMDESASQPARTTYPTSVVTGVAVGMVLLVLLIIGVVGVFILARIRKRRKQLKQEETDSETQPELDGTSKPILELPPESLSPKIEMSTESPREWIELEGSTVPEMDAGAAPARK